MTGAAASVEVDVPRRKSEARNWIATTPVNPEGRFDGSRGASPESCCADAGFAGKKPLEIQKKMRAQRAY